MKFETMYDIATWRADAVDQLWHQLEEMLPKEPTPDCYYWTTGHNEILSNSARAIDYLADTFDEMYGGGTVITGYYDPEDGKRSGETDKRTGYYYCSNA